MDPDEDEPLVNPFVLFAFVLLHVVPSDGCFAIVVPDRRRYITINNYQWLAQDDLRLDAFISQRFDGTVTHWKRERSDWDHFFYAMHRDDGAFRSGFVRFNVEY